MAVDENPSEPIDLDALSFEDLQEAVRIANRTLRVQGDKIVTAAGRVLVEAVFSASFGRKYLLKCDSSIVGGILEGTNYDSSEEAMLDAKRLLKKRGYRFID